MSAKIGLFRMSYLLLLTNDDKRKYHKSLIYKETMKTLLKTNNIIIKA